MAMESFGLNSPQKRHRSETDDCTRMDKLPNSPPNGKEEICTSKKLRRSPEAVSGNVLIASATKLPGLKCVIVRSKQAMRVSSPKSRHAKW